MKLSIVTTLYKSENFVKEFYQRIKAEIAIHTNDYELIFVDDGSPDHSKELVLELRKKDRRIKLFELSRNFGHHYAIQAGLSATTGDLVYLIDCDLETPPEILSNLFTAFHQNKELDVVYAYQEIRKGNWFESISGNIFYTLLNKLSDTPIPRNILTERLMTKHYVDSLLELGDANLFLGGMMSWTGFKQKGIVAHKNQREGKSTYTIQKRINLLINAITSFSGKPLIWLFNFGIVISILSFLGGFTLILLKFYYQSQIQIGWTSLILANVFLLGILSTFLGVIGIYLQKVFKQVQNRPNYIIRKKYE